jgi:type IV pilus assembly protein PilM
MAFAAANVKSMVQTAGSLIKDKQSALGIDIGSSTAKVVELKKDDEGIALHTYGAIELPNMRESSEGIEKGTRSAALTELLAAIHSESKAAGISLPSAETIVTTFETARRDDEQMEKILPTEAKRVIPLPIESVFLEWHRIEHADPRKGASPLERILLIAVRKEAREEQEKITQHASLTPLFYEVELFAAARAAGTFPGECILIADFGARTTRIYLRNEYGEPIAAYSFPEGGISFTKTIVESTHESIAKAEEMKKERGVLPGSPFEQILGEKVAKMLWESMRSANDLLSVEGKKVNRILFSGSGALMPGLVDYAQKNLGLSVALVKPFSLIHVPIILTDEASKIDPTYTIAIGLALRALR